MSGLKRFSARHAGGEHDGAALHGALASAREFAAACGLDPETSARLAIVVEELVENVLTHGAASAEVALGLELTRTGERIAIVLEDTGLEFDPRGAPDPDAPRADRGGGVGLALVRAWAEIRSYARRNGVNRLELELHPVTFGR